MIQNYRLLTGLVKVFGEHARLLDEPRFSGDISSPFPGQRLHLPDKSSGYTTNLRFARINVHFSRLKEIAGFHAF